MHSTMRTITFTISESKLIGAFSPHYETAIMANWGGIGRINGDERFPV